MALEDCCVGNNDMVSNRWHEIWLYPSPIKLKVGLKICSTDYSFSLPVYSPDGREVSNHIRKFYIGLKWCKLQYASDSSSHKVLSWQLWESLL
ncbi:hypothetical protein SUGI_0347550 [Cryptomeria japonica]|nr:hypothetical protein SUGI_0347550 [Cryptomeria japonica]